MDLNYLRNVALALRKGNRLVGWEELGTGHFSHVFHNAAVAPDVVIKLSGSGTYGDGDLTTTSKRYDRDYGDNMKDGFPLYAQWCMKNQHLRGVPKIYHCEQLSATLWLTITEYIPHGFRGDLSNQWVHALPDYLVDRSDHLWPCLWVGDMLSGSCQNLRKAHRRGEPYAATIVAMRNFLNSSNSMLEEDCHTGNVRFRDDGTLVFTDPFKGSDY